LFFYNNFRSAFMDAFMGMVMPVAFEFAPKGWAFCNGQLISIQQNSALFSLLGTKYGGDGTNTFGLPDLRGRVPVGSQGNGPGLSPIAQGERAGSNSVTVLANGVVNVALTAANLPAHTHGAGALTAATAVNVNSTAAGVVGVRAGSMLSATAGGTPAAAAIYLPPGTAATDPVALAGVTTTVAGATDSTGSGAALQAPVSTQAQAPIMQPYIGLNYIIAMQGIYPSRN
jgi:microcystin-dependent protein